MNVYFIFLYHGSNQLAKSVVNQYRKIIETAHFIAIVSWEVSQQTINPVKCALASHLILLMEMYIDRLEGDLEDG